MICQKINVEEEKQVKTQMIKGKPTKIAVSKFFVHCPMRGRRIKYDRLCVKCDFCRVSTMAFVKCEWKEGAHV